MGADPARQRRDAEHAAELHHDRHALHLLGAGRRGGDAALVPLRRAKRDPPLPDRRPFERPRAAAAARADGAGGGRRGGRDRADLLGQRGAHARLLRRARRGARRLRGDGPALPQGSRRPADPGGRARARSALPARGRRPDRRAAQPLHDRARAVRLHGRAAGRVPGAAHGRRRRSRAARRTPPPRRRCATSRPRASRTGSTSMRSPRCRSTSASWAREKGLPVGAPQEFDATYYRHQLAGGMVSTTRRMLEELRRPELFDAVLEEVGRVRAEMGYPIIVTPVSQLVATQAVRNVIDGERWSNVSDETVRYFLGHYGEPAAPVAAGRGRARALAAARRGAAQPRAAASRGRARALRARDLRRGAAAAADDAGGAGGRDCRVSAGSRPARGRTAATRWSTLLREVDEAQVDHAPARAEGRRRWWSGAVRLDDAARLRVRRRRDARAPGRRRSSTSSRGASRSWRRIRASGRPLRDLHQRQPRAAGGIRRRPARGRPRRRRRRAADAACRASAPTWTRTRLDGARACCSRPRRRASTSAGSGCRLVDGDGADAVFVATPDAVDFARARAGRPGGARRRASC